MSVDCKGRGMRGQENSHFDIWQIAKPCYPRPSPVMPHLEQLSPSVVSAQMLSRLTLVAAVFIAACAPTPPPPANVPQVCVEKPVPIPPPPVVATNVAPKPAISLEPLVAGDVARWKITNQSSKTVQLGIEHTQQHWARDCRSPLQRIGADGRMRCMPIRIETDVPAYASLAPGASATLTLSMQFDSHGPEPILPPGQYHFTIPTTNSDDRSNGPAARANFRLEALDEKEAQALAQRVAFATEHGCAHTSELGQRALAWTAPENITLSALNTPGVPWMRARYARFAAMLPEAQEKLRNALFGSTFDAVVAANALLWSRTQPPTEMRETAQRILPSALGVRGFDPILVQAVASSDFGGRIIEAVAWRVSNGDDDEVGLWEAGLSCASARPGDELALADLIHAFRTRAQKAKPELAKILRTRADSFEAQLRERRKDVDEALRIARAGRPPFKGPNTGSIGKGCGYATSGIRPEAVCAGAEITAKDPAVRFLTTPMTLVIE